MRRKPRQTLGLRWGEINRGDLKHFASRGAPSRKNAGLKMTSHMVTPKAESAATKISLDF
jgi:hypothetical protein